MFETFVDLVHERLARDPGMHVYHYGTYENAALKQLMGTYATREDAVDELLRRKVFVNLHTVVRQGLRAGVESYSLKEVEALAPFARRADVKSGMGAVLAYEHWMETRDESLLATIADYNEEDCRATLALRDWLVAHHPEDARGSRRWRRGARRRGRRRARPAARGARRGQPPRIARDGSPASCSSITGARRGPAGGGTSSGATR